MGRDFNRFWAGSLSSNLADGMMLVALPLVAAMLTNDPLLVAGLTMVRFLPWLMIGLFAGVVVDRVDRVRLMVLTNLGRGGALVVLSLLIFTGHASIWVLYAVMFTVMVCEVFYDLAGRAMLPDIAPAGAIDRANSRLVGGQTVMQQFAGGPIAGFLFAVAAFLPLAVNAGAYVLGALVLLGLPLAVRRPKRPEGEAAGAAEEKPESGPVHSVLADVREGLVFVFRGSSLGPIMGFNMVVNMAFMAQSAVLVLLVREHFGVPTVLYGVFIGTSAVGALLGASTVGLIVARFGRFRTELVLFTLAGCACLLFGLAPNAYVAAAAWMVIGYVMTSSNIVLIGAIQLIVPGIQMGRVMACVQMFGAGFGVFGALLGGLLGRVELYYVPVAAGAAVLVGLLLSARALSRVIGQADEVEAEQVAEAERAARETDAERAAKGREKAPDQGERGEDSGQGEGRKEP
ncbi:MFS transporter [Nocardiopsis valliformis]|uniref:MFS transporter n=1 Tax=Nocardiopsis valliformis TaxID=239974 RepID=UPI000365A7BB|nr:MFS transporter [Nocardiopsis valliformis]